MRITAYSVPRTFMILTVSGVFLVVALMLAYVAGTVGVAGPRITATGFGTAALGSAGVILGLLVDDQRPRETLWSLGLIVAGAGSLLGFVGLAIWYREAWIL